jgi:hypothetical protein
MRVTATVIDWSKLEREALRLHARYTTEIVEALELCPWAQEARREGRVETRVFTCTAAQSQPVLDELARLGTRSDIDVAFLLFPGLDLDRLAFAHFVSELRAGDAARHAVGQTVVALADFHPCAPVDVSSAERLVPYLRRTPDLTIQVVRRDALQRVRMSPDQGTSFVDVSQLTVESWLGTLSQSPPSLAARVAKHNLRTVERVGTAALAERIDAILADRHASYSALGMPLPAWKAHT